MAPKDVKELANPVVDVEDLESMEVDTEPEEEEEEGEEDAEEYDVDEEDEEQGIEYEDPFAQLLLTSEGETMPDVLKGIQESLESLTAAVEKQSRVLFKIASILSKS